jgi:transposase
MHATTVLIDLAKDVFELAFADAEHRVIERKRLKRAAFARVLENREPLHVVMEACGSAHYWARHQQRQGHRVELLPPHQVKPYVLRRKTDRTDVDGLLEASRGRAIRPVPIKTPEQQGIQGLHRIREHHETQRTAAINLMRGLLREFGVATALGAAKVRPAVLAALEDGDNELPMALRHALAGLLDQVASHESAMGAIEAALHEFAQRDTRSQRLQQASGIGLITATAMSASIGDLDRFPSGRLRQCAGPHAARMLQRKRPAPGSHHQARQHLRPHAAHPRRARRATRRRRGQQEGHAARSDPGLGTGPGRALRPQQGSGRARQQDRASSVGRRASPHELRSGPRQPANAPGDLVLTPAPPHPPRVAPSICHGKACRSPERTSR